MLFNIRYYYHCSQKFSDTHCCTTWHCTGLLKLPKEAALPCKLLCSETSSKSLAYMASYTLCKKTSCHINILWRTEGLIKFPPCRTLSHTMNSSLFVFTLAVSNLTTSCSKIVIISYTQHVYYICNSVSYKHLHASYKYKQTPTLGYLPYIVRLLQPYKAQVLPTLLKQLLFFSYWSTTNKVYLHSWTIKVRSY